MWGKKRWRWTAAGVGYKMPAQQQRTLTSRQVELRRATESQARPAQTARLYISLDKRHTRCSGDAGDGVDIAEVMESNVCGDHDMRRNGHNEKQRQSTKTKNELTQRKETKSLHLHSDTYPIPHCVILHMGQALASKARGPQGRKTAGQSQGGNEDVYGLVLAG